MAFNIVELQGLLSQAEAAAANEKDIRKGLTRIENLVSNITKEVANVYALLDGAKPVKKEQKARAPKAVAAVDADAPHGRKKDGTPRAKSGRSKEVVA